MPQLHPLQIIFILMMLCLFAFLVLEIRLRMWQWWTNRRPRVMSSDRRAAWAAQRAELAEFRTGSAGGSADTDAVRGGSGLRTGSRAEPGAEPVDADAVTLPRKATDADIAMFLALTALPDGKERCSANAIAKLVGGTREDVLDQIRAARRYGTGYVLDDEDIVQTLALVEAKDGSPRLAAADIATALKLRRDDVAALVEATRRAGMPGAYEQTPYAERLVPMGTFERKA